MVYVFDLSICLRHKTKDSLHFNIGKSLTVFVFKCFERNFIVFYSNRMGNSCWHFRELCADVNMYKVSADKTILK